MTSVPPKRQNVSPRRESTFPYSKEGAQKNFDALKLPGVVAIITGAGRGIGRATAEAFAHQGARVVLCSRTKSEIDDAVASIEAKGGLAVGRKTDIGSPREAEALAKFAIRRFGTIDVLINNAGILGPRVPLAEYPLRAWNEVIRINLSGTYHMTRAVLPFMMRRGSGCIVNVTSSVGRQGRAGWGAYAISKSGIESLTYMFAEELRPSGLRVFGFNPGGTRTRMRAAAYPEEDPSLLPEPSVAAEALVRLVRYAPSEQSGVCFDLRSVPGKTDDR